MAQTRVARKIPPCFVTRYLQRPLIENSVRHSLKLDPSRNAFCSQTVCLGSLFAYVIHFKVFLTFLGSNEHGGHEEAHTNKGFLIGKVVFQKVESARRAINRAVIIRGQPLTIKLALHRKKPAPFQKVKNLSGKMNFVPY